MISAIIPNYNRANLIGYTIKNLINQTLPPDEIIVVDDGSTDHSIDIIKSFGNKVKLIQQKNLGPGAARNLGLKEAKGDYIQFMDSDDLMSINKLEIQFTTLNNSIYDFAYCPWVRFYQQNQKIIFSGPVLQAKRIPANRSMLEWQMGTWALIFQNCLFKKDILLKAGYYTTDMMAAEDGEYLVRILLAGAKPVFTSECLVFYRWGNADQITKSENSEKRQAEDLSKYYEKVGCEIGINIKELQKNAIRELALELFRHNHYCIKNGYKAVSKENPINLSLSYFSASYLWLLDYWDRLKRKLFKYGLETPTSKGLVPEKPSIKQHQLASQLNSILT